MPVRGYKDSEYQVDDEDEDYQSSDDEDDHEVVLPKKRARPRRHGVAKTASLGSDSNADMLGEESEDEEDDADDLHSKPFLDHLKYLRNHLEPEKVCSGHVRSRVKIILAELQKYTRQSAEQFTTALSDEIPSKPQQYPHIARLTMHIMGLWIGALSKTIEKGPVDRIAGKKAADVIDNFVKAISGLDQKVAHQDFLRGYRRDDSDETDVQESGIQSDVPRSAGTASATGTTSSVIKVMNKSAAAKLDRVHARQDASTASDCNNKASRKPEWARLEKAFRDTSGSLELEVPINTASRGGKPAPPTRSLSPDINPVSQKKLKTIKLAMPRGTVTAKTIPASKPTSKPAEKASSKHVPKLTAKPTPKPTPKSAVKRSRVCMSLTPPPSECGSQVANGVVGMRKNKPVEIHLDEEVVVTSTINTTGARAPQTSARRSPSVEFVLSRHRRGSDGPRILGESDIAGTSKVTIKQEFLAGPSRTTEPNDSDDDDYPLGSKRRRRRRVVDSPESDDSAVWNANH